jgi:2-oxoglutarate ferredoxin oxidoreductase subunit alpha
VASDLDTSGLKYCLPVGEREGAYLLLTGAEAVALGKLAGGLGFQTYYPISPATDESVYIEGHANFPDRKEGDHSVVVVQTEDELSAVCMASAAALTGARSSTATSGPGFSLMIEGLGWAGANEVPLVLTNWQRGGPSTGMPTRTEQGDLLFAIRAGHGEFPRIVLASSDLTEAFYDAAWSFNYAERYQMPVIHLLDKALSSTTQTVPQFDLDKISIDRGLIAERPGGRDGKGPYARFAPTESGVTPRTVLGQPGGIHWVTGGERTVLGRVTEDPVLREQQMEKRMRKLELVAREIPLNDKLIVHGPDDADITILSWGSTKGAIRRAMERLEEDGISSRLVHIRLMWPFPAAAVCRLLSDASPLVAVELNYSGQLTLLVQEQTDCSADYLIVKYNGRPMSSAELYRALRTIHEGKAESRIVLRNPLE